MSNTRKRNVRYKGRDYGVNWHPISKEIYVFWGAWKYTLKAYDVQAALDSALSWLNSHAC